MGSASIKQAVEVIRTDWVLIALYGIANITVTGGIWTYVSLVGFFIAFLLQVTVAGRIVYRASLEPIPSASEIIQSNWLNVLVVFFALGLPVLVLFVAASAIELLPSIRASLEFIVRSAFRVVSTFALPIVFLKRTGLVAIPAGLIFLKKAIRQSVWVIGLILAVTLLPAVQVFVLRYVSREVWLACGVLMSVVASFALFLAFAAATQLFVSLPSPRASAA